MKKLMKLMCVFALVFVAGCGASSSTDEQKEVVTNFFDYVKECDITKLKKVASEDVLSGMDLEKMEKELRENFILLILWQIQRMPLGWICRILILINCKNQKK